MFSTLIILSSSFHLSLPSSFPFCLLSEETVRVPVGHPAVVRAAQTVIWSAWSLGPGAAPTQTAPTAPCDRQSPRPAVSLESPSLPEGIASAAAKAHRVAAKALARVRTQGENRGHTEGHLSLQYCLCTLLHSINTYSNCNYCYLVTQAQHWANYK